MTRDWSFADKPRHREVVTIEKIDGRTITADQGWSYSVPAEHIGRLAVGMRLTVETVLGSQVTGMAVVDDNDHFADWLWLKTSAQLDREHDEKMEQQDRKWQEYLDANREDWQTREAALPSALRRRLERFRQNGGDGFDRDGWGYELIICELAVLYEGSDGEDSEEVMAYANENGTSGNQHGYAKMLARHLTDDPADQDAIANSVSALTPLTGDTDYSGAPA